MATKGSEIGWSTFASRLRRVEGIGKVSGPEEVAVQQHPLDATEPRRLTPHLSGLHSKRREIREGTQCVSNAQMDSLNGGRQEQLS